MKITVETEHEIYTLQLKNIDADLEQIMPFLMIIMGYSEKLFKDKIIALADSYTEE